MVLFDHLILDQPSLQQHSLSIFSESGKKISKQGINKRFNESAVALIKALFGEYLKQQLNISSLPSEFSKLFTAIRLMDSTEFKLPASLSKDFPGFGGDGTSACTQIQFEYDILSSKIKHLSIGDARNPDWSYASMHVGDIQSNDLIIRDLGYGTLDIFKAIERKNAYYISRLNTNMIIYEKKDGVFKQLTLKRIVSKLKNSTKQYLDIPIYIGKQAKHPVRLIANLLGPQEQQARLKKKIYRKTKQPEKYRYLSQLNLFITNIDTTMVMPEQIYGLYRIRWQIELIFKTWKSVLKIDHVRKMNTNRFRCYLIGKLIWIMISWDTYMLINAHALKNKNYLLSVFKCFAILKEQAKVFQHAIVLSKKHVVNWLDNISCILLEFGRKEIKKKNVDVLKFLRLNEAYKNLNH